MLICSTLMTSYAAPITNRASIIPSMTFSLWDYTGHETNEFKADQIINYALTTAGTNFAFCRHLSFDKSFDFHLFDKQGHELPKTEKGLINSYAPPPPPSNMQEVLHFKFHTLGGSSIYRWFRPNDLFEIKDPGVYEMVVRYRLLLPMTDGKPDCSAITNAHKFSSCTNLAIIISDPVRVKITKE